MTIRSAAIVLALLIAAPQAVEAGRGGRTMVRPQAKTSRLRKLTRKLNPVRAIRARNARRAQARRQAWNEYQQAIKNHNPAQAAQAYQTMKKNSSRFARPFKRNRTLREMGRTTLKMAGSAAAGVARRGNFNSAIKFYDLTKGIKHGRGFLGLRKRSQRRQMRKTITKLATGRMYRSGQDLHKTRQALDALHQVGRKRDIRHAEKVLKTHAASPEGWAGDPRVLSYQLLSMVKSSRQQRGKRAGWRLNRKLKKAERSALREMNKATTSQAFESAVALLKAQAIERGEADVSSRTLSKMNKIAKKHGWEPIVEQAAPVPPVVVQRREPEAEKMSKRHTGFASHYDTVLQ